MNVIRFSDLCAQGQAKGKRVFIRADLNVPQDDAGVITEDTRIRASIPCIQMALDAGAAVMVTSHLGRPTEGEFKPSDSLAPVAKRMAELMGREVPLLANWVDGVQVQPGQLVLLENCRVNKGEKKNSEELAKKMAALCDIYVNDAFGTAHRAEGTTHGIAKHAAIACAGPLMAASESKPAFKPDAAKGQTLAAPCLACHTADGTRGTPANPILQGQHPEYIVKQLTEFKAGQRPAASVMHQHAKGYSDDELRRIADAVDKYKIPTVKVTGGQRIDLLGVKKEDLVNVWKDIGMPSGHAYAKALRTVKTCVGSEWCRMGTQDSTQMGKDLEKAMWRMYAPHKVKFAVSGCPRNCAEAGIKDVGIIGVDSGWEMYVGGNGGIKTEVAHFFTKLKTAEEVLEYTGAFMQLYREEGWYLERTVHYLNRVGMDYVKKKILEDAEGRKALWERLQFALDGEPDPWFDFKEAAVDTRQFDKLTVPA